MLETLEIRRLLPGSPHLTLVAKWQYEQWGNLSPKTSQEAWQEELLRECSFDGIPAVLLALVKGYPVATASLVEADMETRRELSPWLASVYVLPEWRGQGIASRLVRKVECEAQSVGITRLYLFTPDQQALYHRLGWKDKETLDYQGVSVSILTRELASRRG
ncbi:GNAT family N-acetyltransferase [Pistricoccus aurantiacus]|uniref:GNAT family N-acetyltransferase n=1 Tax=Pistricoccus aurantiacus TaxID=1883414 RepID=UPI00362B27EF